MGRLVADDVEALLIVRVVLAVGQHLLEFDAGRERSFRLFENREVARQQRLGGGVVELKGHCRCGAIAAGARRRLSLARTVRARRSTTPCKRSARRARRHGRIHQQHAARPLERAEAAAQRPVGNHPFPRRPDDRGTRCLRLSAMIVPMRRPARRQTQLPSSVEQAPRAPPINPDPPQGGGGSHWLFD